MLHQPCDSLFAKTAMPHYYSGNAIVAMLRPLFYCLYPTEAVIWWQYSMGAAAMLWHFYDIAPMLVAMLQQLCYKSYVTAAMVQFLEGLLQLSQPVLESNSKLIIMQALNRIASISYVCVICTYMMLKCIAKKNNCPSFGTTCHQLFAHCLVEPPFDISFLIEILQEDIIR